MLTIKTYCGKKHIIVDQDQFNKIIKYKIFYNQSSQQYKISLEPSKYRVLKSFLFNYDFLKYSVKFINGLDNDFRKENIKLISLSESRRSRPSPNKHKGIEKPFNHYRLKVWIAENHSLSWSKPGLSYDQTAGVYNSVLDYIGFGGYRNNVDNYPLDDYDIKKAEEIKSIIYMLESAEKL